MRRNNKKAKHESRARSVIPAKAGIPRRLTAFGFTPKFTDIKLKKKLIPRKNFTPRKKPKTKKPHAVYIVATTRRGNGAKLILQARINFCRALQSFMHRTFVGDGEQGGALFFG